MNNINLINNKNNITGSSLNFEKKKVMPLKEKTPQEKLDRIYRSQGLLGKLFDKIQSAIGLKYSKKSLQSDIDNKKIENIDTKLNKYYDRQKNSTEIAVDLATGIGAAGCFRFLKKISAYSHSYAHNAKFDKGMIIAGLGISAVSGMIIKPVLKRINNIGTPRKDRKRERTILKDMGSGLIDGAAAPLAYAYKLGLLGAVGINSLSRYAFNKKADKDHNLYEHLTSGWIIKAPMLGLALFSALRFHKRVDKIEKAIVKAKDNIKDIQVYEGKIPLSELADITKSNLKDNKTQTDLMNVARKGFFSRTYLKLTKPLNKFRNNKILAGLEFMPKPFKRVMFMNKELIKEKEMINIMRELEQYNIFYPKMIQSMPSNLEALVSMAAGDKGISEMMEKMHINDKPSDGWFKRRVKKFFNKRIDYAGKEGIGSINDFLNKYKSNCPTSRTMSEAQEMISKTFGKKYILQGDKPLGVGTIAESYLAKDSETGKDVVIKMTKKWATAEKLLADRDKMLDSLKRVKESMSEDDYNYQCKLVNSLYDAWSKEIDLKLEAEAAETLGRYAVNYNTVAPITVKDNIFVMERAQGVQFDKFVEYLEKNKKQLTALESETLITKYFNVFFEQLLSVPKKGEKVLHADPHAGNIFVDINNKEKPFTFIDTGNVMRFTPVEAIQNVTSHLDYLIGNSKNISRMLVRGAILPDGMTEKQAAELLEKHLNEIFFSGKFKISPAQSKTDPFSAINNEAMQFMSKNNIILNTNNTNLVKAEITYIANLVSLGGINKHIAKDTKVSQEEEEKLMKEMGKQILESIKNGVINNKRCTIKEVYKRYKYVKDNPEQFFTTLYSYVAPKG